MTLVLDIVVLFLILCALLLWFPIYASIVTVPVLLSKMALGTIRTGVREVAIEEETE